MTHTNVLVRGAGVAGLTAAALLDPDGRDPDGRDPDGRDPAVATGERMRIPNGFETWRDRLIDALLPP